MAFDKTNIFLMTTECARLISLWKYEDEYSFYDHKKIISVTWTEHITLVQMVMEN